MIKDIFEKFEKEFDELDRMGDSPTKQIQVKSTLTLMSDFKPKPKNQAETNKEIELALAVVIILANMSSDEEFIFSLLAVSNWKRKDSSPRIRAEDIDQDLRLDSGNSEDLSMKSDTSDNEEYDVKVLVELAEIKSITKLLNLLAHENPFISEQVSILLANISNSKYFRHFFLTDRCMKAIVKVLRFDRKVLPTEVS